MAKQGRIFAVIFLALLIPVLLKAPESEAKVYRGKCKSNLTWSYDSKTKTMVIDCKKICQMMNSFMIWIWDGENIISKLKK